MANAIDNIVTDSIKAAFRNPKETAFLLKYSMAQKSAQATRADYEKQATHIPPFLIASITTVCNLVCKGCYARANKSCGEHLQQDSLSAERWGELFAEAGELGISFILLAGGEPLMRRDVIEKAAKHKNLIFPIFTNGTMIKDDYINLFDKNRNLLPILSIEGNREQTDERRGAGTYDQLVKVMNQLNQKGVFYGASVTVTTENIETVASEEFVGNLYRSGCKVLFFVEYVPVTVSTKLLAPTDKERAFLAGRQIELRKAFENMIILSFPGDEEKLGGCLAAGRGFFHINAHGGAEPCPFSPYSDTSLKENSLLQALDSPLFRRLKEQNILLGNHDGGCQLFQKEEQVKELVMK
jgi:MoaA/NifB/PqqE/SkfB family radical SAM enzyme